MASPGVQQESPPAVSLVPYLLALFGRKLRVNVFGFCLFVFRFFIVAVLLRGHVCVWYVRVPANVHMCAEVCVNIAKPLPFF